MEVISIDEKNYKDYLALDIVAFSFAYGGAMGSGGEILVITRDAQTYSMNYVFGYMTIEMCYEVCPPLQECSFGFIDVEETPSGWEGISLGAGNFLVFADSIPNSIKQELKGLRPPYRYQSWRSMVLHWLRSTNK